MKTAKSMESIFRSAKGKFLTSGILPLLTALIKAVLWGAFSLLVSGSIRAADQRPDFDRNPLYIRVQAEGFGRVSPAEITAALQSVGSQLWRYCPRTQLNGLDVYHRTDHPQINFKLTSAGRIAIGLATQDTYWAQYSFQFAHEFCHALANYSNNQRQVIPSTKNANLWLEESLCETASLFALRAMSREWKFPSLSCMAKLRPLAQCLR